MQFSKTLMIFACVIITIAFIVTVYDWAFEINADGLENIIAFARWLGMPIVAYMAKTAYENKAKIEQSHLDKLNGKGENK